jgi:hypothetical protein
MAMPNHGRLDELIQLEKKRHIAERFLKKINGY